MSVNTGYVAAGLKTRNEVRADLSASPPLPGGDTALVTTGSGLVPIASAPHVAKYDSNQPRNPAGQSDGGQWTSVAGGGSFTSSYASSGDIPTHPGSSNSDDYLIPVQLFPEVPSIPVPGYPLPGQINPMPRRKPRISHSLAASNHDDVPASAAVNAENSTTEQSYDPEKPVGEIPGDEELKGLSPEEIDKLMKDKNWEVEPTKLGGGTKYVNPEKLGEQVRVMPGQITDPNPVKQEGYAKTSARGKNIRSHSAQRKFNA